MWKKNNQKPFSKEIKEHIKTLVNEYEKKVEDYQNKISSLCDKNLDYIFLKQLMKEVASETGVNVTLTLKDGTVISIDKEKPKKSSWDLNYK